MSAKSFARVLLLVGAVVSTAAAPISSAAAQKDPSELNMWAAQNALNYIRLIWDHLPGAASYTVSCQIGSKAMKLMGRLSADPKLTTDANGLVARKSFVILVSQPGELHRCFLQWGDTKGLLSTMLAFNEVTPIAQPVLTKAAPASVTATATAPGEITVTWSDVPGATAYLIGRAISPYGLKTLCDLCPTRTRLIDRNAQAGSKHSYTVAAVTPLGAWPRTTSNIVIAAGSADEIVTVADPSVDPELKAPSAVRATVSGAASTMVTWDAVSGATSYQVFRSVNGGSLQLIGRAGSGTAGTAIEFPDYLGSFLGVASNTVSALYAVKSVGANGAATQPTTSNEVVIDSKATVTTTTGSSALPSNTRATASSATSVTLTWSPPAAGVPCVLQRSLNGGAYALLRNLAAGTSRYVDNLTGLSTQRPQYQIACGDAKSLSQPVRFPDPVW